MALDTVARAEVKFLRIIDEKGAADPAIAPAASDAEIKRIFEAMILSRAFNRMALNLQREGRLGTYASIFGQEASQVASALAFGPDDWIFPSFRETGVFLSRGYPAWMMFRYWLGDERGMKAPEGLNIFPMSVPVGSHIPHATGAAIAMKLKKKKTVAAAYFGDGGSSRGDFHEALNLAGVYKAPAVFLCQNNQWAISVPRARQTAARTIAQRAFGYGIEGVQVDGNDALAVHKATVEAVERARSGAGPTLIECYTYRLDDHTTSDDAARYRAKAEVEEWRRKEPLIRLRIYMEGRGLWTKEYEESVEREAAGKIGEAVKEMEAFKAPEAAEVIENTCGQLTPRQARELKEFGWR